MKKSLYDQPATVQLSGDGLGLAVAGLLTFKNIVKLREQGKQLISETNAEEVAVDLQGVENSDNSGLVLLLAWIRDAKAYNKKLIFRNIPDFMQRMAGIFGIEFLLEQVNRN